MREDQLAGSKKIASGAKMRQVWSMEGRHEKYIYKREEDERMRERHNCWEKGG